MRGRFIARRLDGLLDEPRPGVRRKITDTHVERVLTTTLESTPRDATHWSTRRLAQSCDEPDGHRAHLEGFRVPAPSCGEVQALEDPRFIDKGRDIVGLYLDPPARALLLSDDEKSQIQALDRTAPLLPVRTGGTSDA